MIQSSRGRRAVVGLVPFGHGRNTTSTVSSFRGVAPLVGRAPTHHAYQRSQLALAAVRSLSSSSTLWSHTDRHSSAADTPSDEPPVYSSTSSSTFGMLHGSWDVFRSVFRRDIPGTSHQGHAKETFHKPGAGPAAGGDPSAQVGAGAVAVAADGDNSTAVDANGATPHGSGSSLRLDSRSHLTSRESLERLWHLVKPETTPLAVAVSTLGVTTAASMLLPLAVGQILDLSLDPHSVWTPMTIGGALLGVFTVQSAFMVLRSALLSIIGERVSARIRRDLFNSLLDQEIAFFDQNRTGDLLNRLSSDAVVVQKALTTNIAGGLRAAFMVVGGTGMLFYMSPQLALLSMAVIPPVGLTAVYFGRYIKQRQKMVQETLGETIEVAEELVGNIRTVRMFAQEEREKLRFADRVEAAFQEARKVGIADGFFNGSIHLAANFSIVTVLGYGGSLVMSGALTAGQLTAFLVYSLYVGINISSLSSVYADIMKALGASARIFAITERQPRLPTKGELTLPNFKGDIQFDGIQFAYPTRPDSPILQDFSFEVPPGKVLAVVGASGTGKSTIGALLTRLYDPDAGAVRFDGVDARTLDPQWLRTVVGTVSQEPVLFAASIADNIRYAKPNASDEEVVEAARLANAHSFISSFSDGYDTLVGERGIQLSGGQRQRVAIARLILKDPPVVVLDEATSALDAESEYAVQDALNRVMQHRTVLSIAHRLSTVKAADSIAVLQGGRIVEHGTFEELTADPTSAFSELVQRQLNQT